MTGSRDEGLRGRTILVGVCGGIAAYKCAGIVSALRQAEADVHVIMTEAAQRFVAPLTFEALSGNPVHTDMFAGASSWNIAHIGLVRTAELLVVLNATATTLAKLAHGIADNLLTACVLATQRPVLVAPAMNAQMWHAAPTQANVRTLQERGIHVIDPASGFLACGEVGEGRLADEEDILAAIRRVAAWGRSMSGERVVVTAGPTREYLDPARFLSNPATGRMGMALAQEAAARGAAVTLICGPTELAAPPGVTCRRVTTAREMHAAVMEHLAGCTLFIGAAAVADFRPAHRSEVKVAKAAAPRVIELEPNPDILAEVSARRPAGCFVVGFAAETEDLEVHAREKLAAKRLDCIVANRIAPEGGAFGSRDNEVILLWGADGREEIARAPKPRVAAAILDCIERLRGSA